MSEIKNPLETMDIQHNNMDVKISETLNKNIHDLDSNTDGTDGKNSDIPSFGRGSCQNTCLKLKIESINWQ